jgi:hypothetical protein
MSRPRQFSPSSATKDAQYERKGKPTTIRLEPETRDLYQRAIDAEWAARHKRAAKEGRWTGGVKPKSVGDFMRTAATAFAEALLEPPKVESLLEALGSTAPSTAGNTARGRRTSVRR